MNTLTICIVIFVITMIGFAIGNKYIPIAAIALISTLALVLTGCLDASTALSCFGNGNVIMLGSMFVISAGLNRTQMSKKFSAFVCKIAKGSFLKVLIGYSILTFVLVQFIYSPLAVSAVVFPMAMTVCKELKVKPSKMIFPLMLIAVGTCPVLPFSATLTETAFMQGFLDSFYPGQSVSAMQFFLGRIGSGLVILIWSIFFAPKFAPDKAETAEEELGTAKAEPAPLSPVREFVGYATFLLVMIGMFTSSFHGLPNWQICLAGALILMAFGVLTKKEAIDNMCVDMLLLYVGCLAIANALSATGAADLIGEACGALILKTNNNYLAGFIFFIVPFLMTQFMLNTGICTIFYSVWAMVCASLGVNPVGPMILALSGAQTAFFTPLATPAVPLAMKFGNYDMKDLLKMSWIPAIIITIVSVVTVMTIFPVF